MDKEVSVKFDTHLLIHNGLTYTFEMRQVREQNSHCHKGEQLYCGQHLVGKLNSEVIYILYVLKS